MTEDEKIFIKEYRRLEELEREKEIKFFECIGDPPHTETFVEGVHDKRTTTITNREDAMRQRDVTRFKTVVDEDKVVIDTSTKLINEPKWD